MFVPLLFAHLRGGGVCGGMGGWMLQMSGALMKGERETERKMTGGGEPSEIRRREKSEDVRPKAPLGASPQMVPVCAVTLLSVSSILIYLFCVRGKLPSYKPRADFESAFV